MGDPPSGEQLLAVRVRVRRIGGGPHAELISGVTLLSDFRTASNEGVVWGGLGQFASWSVEDQLYAQLYVGGEVEGWVTVAAIENEDGVLLVYEDDDGMRWYMELE